MPTMLYSGTPIFENTFRGSFQFSEEHPVTLKWKTPKASNQVCFQDNLQVGQVCPTPQLRNAKFR